MEDHTCKHILLFEKGNMHNISFLGKKYIYFFGRASSDIHESITSTITVLHQCWKVIRVAFFDIT